MAYRFAWIGSLPSYFYQTLIFLIVTTIVIYRYLKRAEKPEFFVQLYLLTMAVKLLAYGAYNIVMIMDDKSGANKNVLFFMLLYVVFTALEIAFLYHKISGKKSQ